MAKSISLSQITTKVINELNAAYVGYEMDQFISVEFTPGVDEESIFERVCTEFGFNAADVGFQLLLSTSPKWVYNNLNQSLPERSYDMYKAYEVNKGISHYKATK